MTGGALAPVAQARCAGHFGEFLQGLAAPDGPVVLVTVPCAALAATVTARPGPFDVDDPRLKASAVAFFAALKQRPQLRFRIALDAPLGGGAGMSTAALRAMAGTAGLSEGLTQAALAAEGAVDPPADAGHVLWASREARSVESYARLPEFHIVGGFWGPSEATRAGDRVFPDVSDLLPMWGHAAERQDRAALAGLATEAARRTTELRGPEADPTLELARALGALGIVRAHTGSARGLLFAPLQEARDAEATLREAGYAQVFRFATGGGA